MIANLTLANVLEQLRNGETATSLAARLGEPPGERCAHSPRRVVPILNRARTEGLLRRQIRTLSDDSCPVAHWSFA